MNGEYNNMLKYDKNNQSMLNNNYNNNVYTNEPMINGYENDKIQLYEALDKEIQDKKKNTVKVIVTFSVMAIIIIVFFIAILTSGSGGCMSAANNNKKTKIIRKKDILGNFLLEVDVDDKKKYSPEDLKIIKEYNTYVIKNKYR